jgi:hypothetical protein
MDPLAELAYSKCIEMVFEAIPAGACAKHLSPKDSPGTNPPTRAAIIQTRAFIISEVFSKAALGSILISCCTTGFAAATMWYDYDTSPKKRKESPRLYGATPDTGRGLFFFVLVTSCSLQGVAKSFSLALLIIVSPKYVARPVLFRTPPPTYTRCAGSSSRTCWETTCSSSCTSSREATTSPSAPGPPLPSPW